MSKIKLRTEKINIDPVGPFAALADAIDDKKILSINFLLAGVQNSSRGSFWVLDKGKAFITNELWELSIYGVWNSILMNDIRYEMPKLLSRRLKALKFVLEKYILLNITSLETNNFHSVSSLQFDALQKQAIETAALIRFNKEINGKDIAEIVKSNTSKEQFEIWQESKSHLDNGSSYGLFKKVGDEIIFDLKGSIDSIMKARGLITSLVHDVIGETINKHFNEYEKERWDYTLTFIPKISEPNRIKVPNVEIYVEGAKSVKEAEEWYSSALVASAYEDFKRIEYMSPLLTRVLVKLYPSEYNDAEKKLIDSMVSPNFLDNYPFSVITDTEYDNSLYNKKNFDANEALVEKVIKNAQKAISDNKIIFKLK